MSKKAILDGKEVYVIEKNGSVSRVSTQPPGNSSWKSEEVVFNSELSRIDK